MNQVALYNGQIVEVLELFPYHGESGEVYAHLKLAKLALSEGEIINTTLHVSQIADSKEALKLSLIAHIDEQISHREEQIAVRKQTIEISYEVINGLAVEIKELKRERKHYEKLSSNQANS